MIWHIGLSYLFHIQVGLAKNTGAFYVDAVNAREGVDDRLAAVDEEGVVKSVGDYLDRHSWLDADAVELADALGGYTEFWHSL